MTIPYVPSWAEQNQENIRLMLQALAKGIAPDFYAQKAFEQLSQQDPGLIERISNMDDSQRAAYSRTLGFKNKDPLKLIGAGPQRQAREQKQLFEKTATPEQLAEMQANQYGTRTQAQIDREGVENKQKDEDFATRQKINQNALTKDRYTIKNLELQAAEDDAAIAAYPEMRAINIANAVEDALSGQIDPMLADRIAKNNGLKLAFDKRMDTRVKQIAAEVNERELRLSNALMKDREQGRRAGSTSNDPENLIVRQRAIGGAYTKATQDINSKVNEINQVLAKDKNLKNFLSMNPSQQQKMLKMTSPENRATLEGLKIELDAVKEDQKFYGEALRNVSKEILGIAQDEEKAGVVKPEPLKVISQDPPPDQRGTVLAQRIESGALTLEAALADARVPEAYKVWLKKRYGK